METAALQVVAPQQGSETKKLALQTEIEARQLHMSRVGPVAAIGLELVVTSSTSSEDLVPYRSIPVP